MAPVLIGFAALAVDGGYWIGTQEALQSQANAGAISAVRAETYGLTSTTAIDAVAQTNALQANSDVPTATVATTLSAGSAKVTSRNGAPVYLARALGVKDFTLGATATAGGAPINETVNGCLIAFSTSAAEAIYVTGGASIVGNNCGVISNSTASSSSNGQNNAIVAEPSAQIIAPEIMAAGGIYADTNGKAYIGAGTGKTGVVEQNGSPAADPLASMGNAPPLPAMPADPPNGTATNISSSGQSFGYSPWTQSWGGCTDSSGDCYVNAGNFNGFNVSIHSFEFRTGTSTPNGNSVFTITGMVDVGTYGPSDMQAGTYYLSGASTNGTISNYALETNVPSFSIADGSTVYLNGGADLHGYQGSPFTIGSGFYYFDAASGQDAFTANVPDLQFDGGTYIFNGPVNISAADNVSFGPGIYIFANGNLTVGGGASITSNGATFVFIDGAGFSFNGGSQGIDMVAPSTNCVPPSQYPETKYAQASPFDGTNGQGICGIVFYQARNDAAVDSLAGSASIGIDGVIYAPATNLSLSGDASISAGPSSGTGPGLGILVNTIALTGSASVTLNDTPTSPLSSTQIQGIEPILTK